MSVDISELDKERAGEAWRIYQTQYNRPSRGVDEHRVPAEIAAWLTRKAYAEWIAALEDDARYMPELIAALEAALGIGPKHQPWVQFARALLAEIRSQHAARNLLKEADR